MYSAPTNFCHIRLAPYVRFEGSISFVFYVECGSQFIIVLSIASSMCSFWENLCWKRRKCWRHCWLQGTTLFLMWLFLFQFCCITFSFDQNISKLGFGNCLLWMTSYSFPYQILYLFFWYWDQAFWPNKKNLIPFSFTLKKISRPLCSISSRKQQLRRCSDFQAWYPYHEFLQESDDRVTKRMKH